MIEFSSIYGFKEREPLIHFKWGNQEGSVSITEARAHAIAVLETVEAAIGDAFFFEFAAEKLAKDKDQAEKDKTGAVLMNEFREWRQERGFGGGIDLVDRRKRKK